jgi:hypothetical protein
MGTEKEEPGTYQDHGSGTPEEIPVRRLGQGEGTGPAGGGQITRYGARPDPVTLAVQDLLQIPRQVLPEATYTHLKNAGKEAFLAVVTLIESINSAINNPRKYTADEKSVKHIDVE